MYVDLSRCTCVACVTVPCVCLFLVCMIKGESVRRSKVNDPPCPALSFEDNAVLRMGTFSTPVLGDPLSFSQFLPFWFLSRHFSCNINIFLVKLSCSIVTRATASPRFSAFWRAVVWLLVRRDDGNSRFLNLSTGTVASGRTFSQ